MNKSFHETFAVDDVPLPSERSTGLVFTAVALIVAFLWRSSATVLLASGACAAVLLVLSFFAPTILRPLNIAWFRFGMLLNRIVSPLVMFVLFAVAILPFGLAMQLRSDPLRKRRPDDDETLWVDRRDESAPSSMTNQF